MLPTRRNFMKVGALGTAAVVTGSAAGGTQAIAKEHVSSTTNARLDALASMVDDVKPISVAEHRIRIEKAQRLMKDNGIDACFFDAGTSMRYFCGIKWNQSERMMAMILPADGEPHYVAPKFEEEKIAEIKLIGDDVRTWEEHESPYERVAQLFSDLKITGTVAMEERVRFFLFDGIRKQAPNINYVSADPVTIPCRLYKRPTEIALMQKAFDITMAAYAASLPSLEEGMTPADFTAVTREAHKRLGAPGGIWCSFGEATAFPHGSSAPQFLKKGDVVLMDGGCDVHGYRSDISRTIVFGAEPTPRQAEIWNIEKEAQAAGFDAAKLGDPAENVDAAARKVIVDAGFGPDYQVPGLPHRTGHGIGMDGHEWGNIVRGNTQPLEEGMCFSIEPTLAIYGEFGVRLEDCAYMTAEGAKWFTQPSRSITEPLKS
ncbi:MAG: Xaa-Pro peptidase family protein [Pseudomonadota bacterium]